MYKFSVAWLATCIAFADILFPYTALALGAWVVFSIVGIRLANR